MIKEYERFLRLDGTQEAGVLMRGRAVYMICWTLVVTQIINMVFITYTYKAWTFDHLISLVACIAVIGFSHLLRYTKIFPLYAAFFSFLIFAGIGASAIPDGTGVNSALLPLLVAGVIMNGFISGWRMVVGYTLCVIAFVWTLYVYTAPTPPLGAGYFAARNFQRAVQATLAFALTSTIIGLFSINMNRLFKMLEESVATSQKADLAKSQFLANMSHELRTPLNGVIGMTELLLRTDLDPTQTKYAKIVNGCSEGLVTIINDVLDLSKLDAGKIVTKPVSFNLKEMIVSLLHLHHPAVMKKNLNLYLHYGEDMPVQFLGDESRLRQVTNNLIGNAVKFTNSGAIEVFVQGHMAPDGNFKLSVYVKDTGIGIPKTDLERVFNRFEQVDSSRSTQTQGTGLGLAISRELVEAMGGTMTVTSEISLGTTFAYSIDLPLCMETTPIAIASEPISPTQIEQRLSA